MSGSPSFAFLTATLPERASLLEECVESVNAQSVGLVPHWIEEDINAEGPAAVRNRLAKETNADWLIPLDDDDLIDPNFLEVLSQHLDGADVVYPWCRVEDFLPGLPAWTPNRLFRAESLLRFNFIPVTALVSHELWDAVGGMPEGVASEDWRFWQRCLSEGARFKLVPEVLWTYRRGYSGASRNEWQTLAA